MTVKSASDIRLMEASCRLAAKTLEHAAKFVRVGVSTNEIDQIVHDFILSHEATPSPLNYHGFPKSICTSINDVICHGVPDERTLQSGDIVNIDVTTFKNGFHGDISATFFVGEVSEEAMDLTEVAKQAMFKGIEVIRPYATTGDIGFAISRFVTKRGYWVVQEIGGHGIGKNFHEDPFVPSHGKRGRGDRLLPFVTITVEPMVNQTGAPIREEPIADSTIKCFYTSDGSLSAQFEHTVLVTDNSYEILTLI